MASWNNKDQSPYSASAPHPRSRQGSTPHGCPRCQLQALWPLPGTCLTVKPLQPAYAAVSLPVRTTPQRGWGCQKEQPCLIIKSSSPATSYLGTQLHLSLRHQKETVSNPEPTGNLRHRLGMGPSGFLRLRSWGGAWSGWEGLRMLFCAQVGGAHQHPQTLCPGNIITVLSLQMTDLCPRHSPSQPRDTILHYGQTQPASQRR